MWLLLVICCIVPYSVDAGMYSVIKGNFDTKDRPAEMQLMIVRNGVPVKYAGTTIASNGSFAFMFNSEEAGFYYLYDGSNYCRIYVKPGQEMEITHTGKYWRLPASCSKENQWLEQWRNRENSLKYGEEDLPYSAFFPRFDSVRLAAVQWLAGHPDKACGEMLKPVVELDLLNHFISFLSRNQKRYDSEEQQSNYYQQMIKQFPFTGENILEQPYGMNLIRQYFGYKRNYIMRGRSYTFDQQLAEINSPMLRAEYILAETDISGFNRFCEYQMKYFPALQDDGQRLRLIKTKGRPRSSMKKGELAPNFILPDTAGNFKAVADLRGKYKYIDIWATWCAPCKAEIPALQKLEEEFAGEDIAFISISIDKNRKAWNEFVHQQNLGGMQLWAGGSAGLPEEFLVGTVPRFVLIDKEGNWVDTNAARPSNPALKELLKNLLRK